jgi:hypothetical protein
MGRNWGMRSECGEAGQVWVVRGTREFAGGPSVDGGGARR